MMYTLDGLWYNVLFFDVIAFIAAIFCIIFGLLRIFKRKIDFEAKGTLVMGVLCLILTVQKGIQDIHSIQQRDFIKVQGVFEYYNREPRAAPFTAGYVFSTGEPKKQTYYLDSFTLRKHLGAGFEFSKGSKYELIYDSSSKILVGVKSIDDDSAEK